MNASKTGRPPRPVAERILGVLLFVFFGLLAADLVVLGLRDIMLPTQAPPSRPHRAAPETTLSPGMFAPIADRNMFNSDGVIPEPLIAKQSPDKRQELPPIPSQLPLTLMGTLVHSNPDKSLAAIEMKGKNQILSYHIKQDIPGMASVEKIERMKVFIRNRNSGRLEYIEMKSTSKISLRTANAQTPAKDVKKTGENEYEIKRADLMKYTNDLSSVLMQARVLPARRGGSGEIYGYRLVEMQPGSIYAQLGLQAMDVIMGVNGTPVTNPQQAMEMYNTLRNSPGIEISVERDGRKQDLKYKISP